MGMIVISSSMNLLLDSKMKMLGFSMVSWYVSSISIGSRRYVLIREGH